MSLTAAVSETFAAPCVPFIKWVGGKRKLLPALLPLLPAGIESMRHVEPFLGGGAMFFARGPRSAALSDINADLIATYTAVRDAPHGVIRHLQGIARSHDERSYYQTRSVFNARESSGSERAAQFIYLNKTCFNGLFRVNRKGEFNVPMGRYANPSIADARALLAASERLKKADLTCATFERLIDTAGAGDFVYMDPPYEPVTRTASFTSYSKDGFSQDDQSRLRDVFRELDRRGAKLMLSNSDTPLIRNLYSDYTIDVVIAPRAISCNGNGRGGVHELVVRNYGAL